jgi:hypothetical protein
MDKKLCNKYFELYRKRVHRSGSNKPRALGLEPQSGLA